MPIDSLSEVQGALLTYTSLDTERVPTDPQNPLPQMLVHFDEIHDLRIFCANDALATENPESSSVYYFVSRFPHEIPAGCEQSIQRILGVFNHLLPLGMLELNPEEGIYFRHMLLAEEAVMDGLLGLDIVQALQRLLPRIFDWLFHVIHHRENQNLNDFIRDGFRDIVRDLPVPQMKPAQMKFPGLRRKGDYTKLWLLFSIATGGLVGSLTGPIEGLATGAACIAVGVLGQKLYGRFNAQQEVIDKQRRELRFFWQLLEAENMKLASYDQSLENHRAQVAQKISDLNSTSITYPSDIVRLRSSILFLKELQNHLAERMYQLKVKRRELENNRQQLMAQRKELQDNTNLSLPERDETAFEDILVQNLIVTLEHLDFQLQLVNLKQAPSPTLFIYLRNGLPPVSIYWLRNWVPGRESGHSWMLCFDLTLPLPRQQEMQALMELFNRFLPLGALIANPHSDELILRYRFVRLQGDLSAILVMEILEVMASFGERLQQRAQEYLRAKKPMDIILAEAEQEFEALAR